VRMEQIEQVNLVLKEIGADHIPQILVWNKIDAAGLEPATERDEADRISRVFISARSGEGLDLLREAIVEAAKAAPGLSHLFDEQGEGGEDFADDVDADTEGKPADTHGGLESGPADSISTNNNVGPR
jgi:GTP-binding protein HflX